MKIVDGTRRREPVRKKPVLPWTFGAVLLLAVAVVFILRQAEVISAERRVTAMQQDIQHYAAVNESLEKQLEVLKSDEYVEKTAREKLGLVMPGEVQYMLITFKGKE